MIQRCRTCISTELRRWPITNALLSYCSLESSFTLDSKLLWTKSTGLGKQLAGCQPSIDWGKPFYHSPFREVAACTVTRHDIVWLFINLILPFLLISLLNDFANIRNNIASGVMAIIIVLSAVVIIVVTKFVVFRPSFLMKVDPNNSYLFCFADVVRTCVNCGMFVFGDFTNYTAWIWIAFASNMAVIYIQHSE